MELRPKSLMLAWQCHQLLTRFLAKGHLPRVSLRSVTNDKGDNEIIPWAVLRSHGICLTIEENPGKLQLGDSDVGAVRPVIASNGVPYLQMSSVGLHSSSGREKEGRLVWGE